MSIIKKFKVKDGITTQICAFYGEVNLASQARWKKFEYEEEKVYECLNNNFY